MTSGGGDAPNQRIALRWGAATHAGIVRPVNQDAVLAGPTIFAVADGMGGHAAGDVASSLAIATLAHAVGDAEFLPASAVVSAVREANDLIIAEAYRDGAVAGMGTTLALVAALGDDRLAGLLVLNIGDSRIYRFGSDDSSLVQLSVDHSVVAELVAAGDIDEAAAATHPDRNAITRALGIDDEVDLDMWQFDPVMGDRFVVCSDGLVREVSDEAIAHRLAAGDPATVVAERLLEDALAAGASDNVSVVVLDLVADDHDPAIEVGAGDTRPVEAGDTRPRSGR